MVEIKKNFKRRNGEEDPVVIAQRFLNIFRQLHIFTEERKKDFNQEILALPPEIRGMFGNLPGGSLLQEYVDDLEQNAGIFRDHSQEGTARIDTESAQQTPILAAALAAAQPSLNNFQAPETPKAPDLQQKLQDIHNELLAAKKNNDVQKIKEIQQVFQALTGQPPARENPAPAAEAPTPPQAPAVQANTVSSARAENVTMVLDRSFTVGIAQAVSEAVAAVGRQQFQENQNILQSFNQSQLQISNILKSMEEYRRQDNSQLAQTLTNHQLEIAKMMLQNNNTNANRIEINNAPMPVAAPVNINPAPEFDLEKFLNAQSSLFQEFNKSQTEIFKEMAEAQAKEFSAIISVALKESQEASTQNFIEALKELQKTMPAPVYNVSQVSPAAPSQPAGNWDWEYIEEPEEVPEAPVAETSGNTADDEWEYVEEPEEVSETPVAEVSENAADDEWEYIEEPEEVSETPVAEVSENAADDEWEYIEEPEEVPEAPIAETSENTADDEWEYVEEPEEVSETPVAEASENTVDGEWEYVGTPSEETIAAADILQNDFPDETEENETLEYAGEDDATSFSESIPLAVKQDNDIHVESSEDFDMLFADEGPSAETPAVESPKEDTVSEPPKKKKKKNKKKKNKKGILPNETLAHEPQPQEEALTAPFSEQESFADDFIAAETEPVLTQPDDATSYEDNQQEVLEDSLPDFAQDNSENDGWEWEYVEEDEEEPAADNVSIPLDENAAADWGLSALPEPDGNDYQPAAGTEYDMQQNEDAEEDDGDWEWEYVEEDEAADTAEQTLPEDDEDWQAPAIQDGAEPLAETESDESETGGDWEYVEEDAVNGDIEDEKDGEASPALPDEDPYLPSQTKVSHNAKLFTSDKISTFDVMNDNDMENDPYVVNNSMKD